MPTFGEILGQEPEESQGGSFASILAGGTEPVPQYLDPPEEGSRLKALGLALVNPLAQLGGLLASTPGELIGRELPEGYELDPITRAIRPLKGLAERTQEALTEERARLFTDPQTTDTGLDDDIDKLFAWATLPTEVAGDLLAGGAISKGLGAVGRLARDPLRFGKTFGEAIGQATRPVRGQAARWLTSTGGRSKEVRAALETRTQELNATTAAITEEGNALRRMIDEHLVENPQVDRKGFLEQVNSVLDGSDPGTGVVMPDGIRRLSRAMRDEIDGLSKAMIDEGVVDERLAETFRSNMGSYVTRAYRAFEDPKHIQKLRKTGDWDRIKADIRESGQEFQLMDDAELDRMMEHWASRDETTFWKEHEGIFRERGDIPKPIRELMGEYTDPGVRYFKTVHRMARNLEQHRMYSAMRDLGLREGWLSEKRAPGLRRQVGDEGTALARSPVGGLFTDSDMLAVLKGVHNANYPKTLRQIAGWAKWGKTVGSIQAQARNIEANPLLLAAGGNLGTTWLLRALSPRGSKLGIVSSLRNQPGESGRRVVSLLDELGEDVSMEKIRGLSHEALRRGVFGQQVDMGDIEAWLQSSRAAESGLKATGEDAGIFLRSGRAAAKGAERLYKAGDEVFKFAAWRSEMAKLRLAYPNKTEVELMDEAADIVKDTMPTYSRVPKLVEEIRKWPVGNFVSFVSEIPRNTANNLRIGLRQIREGAQTGNWRLSAIGTHRLASLSAAYATPWAASAGIRAIRDKSFGQEVPTGDQEKWASHLAPPWMRHGNNLLWSVTPEGEMTVVDLSFSDPFAQVNDSIRAAIQAGEVDDDFEDRLAAKLKGSIGNLFEPYATAGVVGGAAIPALTGQTMTGRELHPEDATLGTTVAARGGHVLREMMPGTLSSLNRISKAWANEAEPWGRTYDLGTESVALFGPRPYTFRIGDALKIRAGDFARAVRSASFEQGVVDRTEIEGKKLGAAAKYMKVREAASLRERAFQDLAMASRAASELGVSNRSIFRALDEVLSKEDAALMMRAMQRADDPDSLADLSDLFLEMEERQTRIRNQKNALRGPAR